jgi:biotin operon repressor
MNCIDRLLAQIVYLQSKSVVTADDITDHFGLSVRTIYRDILALGEAGVPIVAEAGVGYSLKWITARGISQCFEASSNLPVEGSTLPSVNKVTTACGL